MNFFFHKFLQNISLFLDSGNFFNKCINIGIVFIILIAIFKYRKNFRPINIIIKSFILFKQRFNFIGTLESNKFFYLPNIIVVIYTISIKKKDYMIIKFA